MRYQIRQLFGLILLGVVVGAHSAEPAKPSASAPPAAPASSAPAAAVSAGEYAARTFVENFQLGSHLERLATQAAQRTQTYIGLVSQIGVEQATKRLSQEMAVVRPQYQEQWNRYLAQSYAEYLAPEEISSLATLGKASPYVKKLQDVNPQIAAAMKKRAEPLLVELVTKVLVRIDQNMATSSAPAPAPAPAKTASTPGSGK